MVILNECHNIFYSGHAVFLFFYHRHLICNNPTLVQYISKMLIQLKLHPHYLPVFNRLIFHSD